MMLLQRALDAFTAGTQRAYSVLWGGGGQEPFSWAEPVHIFLFCNFSWSEGDLTRNSWFGSRVFYY